ncbi:MAG: hypothetical protein ACLFV3_08840 [Phycisphaeraceae bacterium]
MQMRFRSAGILLLVALALGGCAQQATIRDWQAAADEQIRETGHGDPNFARNLERRNGWRMFSVLGGPYPAKSRDVHGVLVGQETAAGQPWSVFLLGVVDKRQVEDVRIAAVSGPEVDWRIGKPNPEAMATYRQDRQAPGAVPAGYRGWPAEDDIFELTGTGDRLRVTETTSGATWTLDVTRKDK